MVKSTENSKTAAQRFIMRPLIESKFPRVSRLNQCQLLLTWGWGPTLSWNRDGTPDGIHRFGGAQPTKFGFFLPCAQNPTYLARRLNGRPPTWPAFGPVQWASRPQPAPIPRLRPTEGRRTAFPRGGCGPQKRASAGWG